MKILIIRYKKTSGVPEGGEKASEENLRVWKSIAGETNVDTYYIHDEARRHTLWDYVTGLAFMPLGYYFGLSPRRVKEIVSMAKGYDVVFIDRSVFGIVAKQLKANNYPGRVICFFHNVETVYFNAKYARSPLRWLVVPCADRNDRWACQHADRTIVLSERDDSELFLRYDRLADQQIPISLADRCPEPHDPHAVTAAKPLCLFLGAYFPANVEGIEWFVKEVLPHVDIRMQIAGKGMERLKDTDWLSDDIQLIANVPDLTPLFEAADIMVLPIFKGSGMKVKTCESMMYGKNIIGTPEAWAGYDVDYSRAGACCLTAKDFIAAINDFCQHPRPRFNTYTREVFLTQYSAARMVEKFRSVLL